MRAALSVGALADASADPHWWHKNSKHVQVQQEGVDAFYRFPEEKVTAICITGALRRLQHDALRSWAHVKHPLNAALYLAVTGTEEERKPLSDERRLAYEVNTLST